MEAPATCARFTSRDEYIRAWGLWFSNLDRSSAFWREEAEKKARKKKTDCGTAFAGLLVFDLLGLAAASRASVALVNVPMAESLTRSEVFTVMAAFVEMLPFATDTGKHDAAAAFFSSVQADVVFTQVLSGFELTKLNK